MYRILAIATAIWMTIVPVAAHAEDAKSPYGTFSGNFRYRYEFVDQEGLANKANASTARLRLGYQSPSWEGLSAFGEIEGVQHIGAQRFNDGMNGKATYPRVNDPDMAGINQLYLNYQYDKLLQLRVGRQGIKYDNQRFVSWSQSRQNDTSYDAAVINFYPLNNKDLELNYDYSRAQMRYSGNASSAGRYTGQFHVLHAQGNLPKHLTLTGYTYLFGFEEQTEAALSAKTYGTRLTWNPKGDDWQPLAALEFAHQSSYRNNPVSYSANYYWIEGGLQKKGTKVSFIYEYLGSNGRGSIQTGLGSSHTFNGWADVVNATPVEGLKDYQIWAETPIPLRYKDQNLKLLGQLHRFDSVDRGLHYGNEYDAAAVYEPVKNHIFTAQMAHYDADQRFTDTQKIWLSYEFKF